MKLFTIVSSPPAPRIPIDRSMPRRPVDFPVKPVSPYTKLDGLVDEIDTLYKFQDLTDPTVFHSGLDSLRCSLRAMLGHFIQLS